MQFVGTLTLLTLLGSLLSSEVLAQTANSVSSPNSPISDDFKYVDDKLVILVRTGQSNKHKIIRAISSGAKLLILETNEKYSRIKSKDGTEGWVLNQHLSDEPIARHRLLGTQKQVTLLEARLSQKDKDLSDLNKTHNKLKRQFERMENKLAKLEEENNQVRSLAAKPLKLSTENKELAKQTISLEGKLSLLNRELVDLRDETEKQWFLTGAAVIFIGILIGLWVPRFRRHRKNDWGTIR